MRDFQKHAGFPILLLPGNTRGFTLLEAVIAVAILAFGILAVASMQVSSIRGNAFAGDVTEATTWANDELEKLSGLPWDDPLLQDTDGDGLAGLRDTGFDNSPGTTADADQSPVVRDRYTIFWNIADDEPVPNTKTVGLVILWLDHGRQKSMNINRIIPKVV
jgi:type II secretory pathway pseudopilin PulG